MSKLVIKRDGDRDSQKWRSLPDSAFQSLSDLSSLYGDFLISTKDYGAVRLPLAVPLGFLLLTFPRRFVRVTTFEEIKATFPDVDFRSLCCSECQEVLFLETTGDVLDMLEGWMETWFPLSYLALRAGKLSHVLSSRDIYLKAVAICMDSFCRAKSDLRFHAIGRPDLLHAYSAASPFGEKDVRNHELAQKVASLCDRLSILNSIAGDSILTPEQEEEKRTLDESLGFLVPSEMLRDRDLNTLIKIDGRRVHCPKRVGKGERDFSLQLEFNALADLLNLLEIAPSPAEIDKIACSPLLDCHPGQIFRFFEERDPSLKQILTGILNRQTCCIYREGSGDVFAFRTVEKLRWREFDTVAHSRAVTEESPFIFKANDPYYQITEATDKQMEEALDFACGGWLKKLDLSRSYITGSMICAVVGYFSQRHCSSLQEWLEIFYPSIYTDLQDDHHGNETSLLSHLLTRKVKVEAQYHRDSRQLILTLNCSDEGDFKRTVCRYTEVDLFNARGRFRFLLSPGVDVDIAVETQDRQDFEEIAHRHFSAIKDVWPVARLNRIDKSSGNFMYRVESERFDDYLSGFRSVEIYMNDRRGIVTHHLAPVRSWKGPLSGIYCSASAMEAFATQTIREFHYFAGKAHPWQTILKYMQRGFHLSYELGKISTLIRNIPSADMPARGNINIIKRIRNMVHTSYRSNLYCAAHPAILSLSRYDILSLLWLEGISVDGIQHTKRDYEIERAHQRCNMPSLEGKMIERHQGSSPSNPDRRPFISEEVSSHYRYLELAAIDPELPPPPFNVPTLSNRKRVELRSHHRHTDKIFAIKTSQ